MRWNAVHAGIRPRQRASLVVEPTTRAVGGGTGGGGRCAPEEVHPQPVGMRRENEGVLPRQAEVNVERRAVPAMLEPVARRQTCP